MSQRNKDKEMMEWLNTIPLQVDSLNMSIRQRLVIYNSIAEKPRSDLLVYLGCE